MNEIIARLITRGGTAAQWTAANPILALNELGRETDTGKKKWGDGITSWNDLAYETTGGGAVASVTGSTVDNTDPANPVVNADPAGAAAAALSSANSYTDSEISANAPNEPATQIVYGTGSGITSSNELTYDSVNKVLKLGSQASKGTVYGVQLLPYDGANNPIVMGSSGGLTAIWLNKSTPSSNNYTIREDSSNLTILNGTGALNLAVSNSAKINIAPSWIHFLPLSTISTGATDVFFFRTPPAFNQMAGVETIGFHVDMATNNLQHSSNTAISVNRDFLIQARTHSFVSATGTITDAGTLVITGAPIAGTNAVITNPYSIWSQAGRVRLQGLPTASAGLQAGELWNDLGTVKIV